MKPCNYLIYILLLILTACSNDEAPSTTQDTGKETANTEQVSSQQKEPGGGIHAEMRGTVGSDDNHPGKDVYEKTCAQCHSQAVLRAPHISFLQMLPSDMILRTMNEGVMQPMAAQLSPQERIHVAEYLAGPMDKTSQFPIVMCAAGKSDFDYSQHPLASGWGINRGNTRFIDADLAQLTKGDVKNLKLKWGFAFPGMTRARSQASLAGGAVFIGSQDGTVYSLDAKTGCVRWTFRASAEVRTGITIGDWPGDTRTEQAPLIYFADLIARTYAVNAITGELVWVEKVDDHPTATVTAQPVLYNDTIYQPVSSLEEAAAVDPAYECCSFRGSIVALDARSGQLKWKRYTITEEPKEVGTTSKGTKILAPSGAAIWNTPAIDEERQLLYIGTGDNYSSPAQATSDSLIALTIDSGDVKWIRQVTQGDAWNVACLPFIPEHANCPEEEGPDVDFAASPMHIIFDNREILIGAQKSGDVYGIDPSSTEIVWHQKVGRGGIQGGINFGLAAEKNRIFVPVADFDDDVAPMKDAKPGLYALDAFTGETIWSNPADNICAERKDCDPGISAPVTAIPDVVFAGHMDAWLRAYDSATGKILWEYDTFQKIKTLSGEIAHGGSMSGGSGPIISGGRVYVTSGYGIYFHMPGNVLLMFEAESN